MGTIIAPPLAPRPYITEAEDALVIPACELTIPMPPRDGPPDFQWHPWEVFGVSCEIMTALNRKTPPSRIGTWVRFPNGQWVGAVMRWGLLAMASGSDCGPQPGDLIIEALPCSPSEVFRALHRAAQGGAP